MALNKLAHLSLVNKVTSELENHIGIADKTLSEFVIDLAEKHADARSFQKALDEVGAELSFDLVRNLLEMIQRMRPKTGGGADGGGGVHVEVDVPTHVGDDGDGGGPLPAEAGDG